MWDLTGLCLLFTCMTGSTVRSNRFVFTIYMILYDRFHCETWPVCVFDIHVWPITEGCVIDPYTDILPCCHVITEASWWVRDYPQKSRKKTSFSKLELELFPPPLWRKWLWQGVLQYQQPSYFDLYQYAFQYFYIHSNAVTKELIS